MTRLGLASIFVFMLLAGACGRVNCVNDYSGFFVRFSGYDTDRGVQVLVSKFPASGGSKPIRTDTFEIDSNNVYAMRSNDTGGISRYPSEIGIYHGYNWQFSVPSTGKVDHIVGLEYTDDTRPSRGLGEGGGTGQQCFNVYTGYYLNGKHMTTQFTGAVSSGNSSSYVTLTKN